MLAQVCEDRFYLNDCELRNLCTEVGRAGDAEMQFTSWSLDSSSIHTAAVLGAAADHPSRHNFLPQSRLFFHPSGNGAAAAAAESGGSQSANGIDLTQDQSAAPTRPNGHAAER